MTLTHRGGLNGAGPSCQPLSGPLLSAPLPPKTRISNPEFES